MNGVEKLSTAAFTLSWGEHAAFYCRLLSHLSITKVALLKSISYNVYILHMRLAD